MRQLGTAAAIAALFVGAVGPCDAQPTDGRVANESRIVPSSAFVAEDLIALPLGELGHERRQRVQPALFAADTDQS
jgi:hypothetical protein